MTEHNFALLPEEDVMFERPHVVVTNKRLLATNRRSRLNTNVDVSLSDVGTPKQYNGGQKNRRAVGAKLFGSGIAINALALLDQVASINANVELILFGVGSLAVVVGVYFLLASLLQVRPNTTVVFPVIEGEQIVIPFPDWDNVDADELTRQFRRAKRRL